jgi:outer membrane protein assembly factor BamB
MISQKCYLLPHRLLLLLTCLAICVFGMTELLLPARAQVSVLTQHNDNSRTGANLQETILNPTNVNVAQFGKLFSVQVDGQVYAQPLYAPHIAIPNQGTHNVVYVVTMHNNVYACDADDGTQLWVKNFGTPIPTTDVYPSCCPDTMDQIGIRGTPVIDPAALIPRSDRGAIYFVSCNKNSDGTYHQWLNALDITTGTPKYGSPIEINAAYGSLHFNPKIQNQRPAITLANGTIYIAWASYSDTGPYHGWVMSYNATNLQQTGVYVNTPTGTRGGIWQSGQGLVVDANGNIYFSGGNGSFSADGTNTGNSFVKLSPTLNLLDWFTPYNSNNLNAGDMDLGASGVLGLPGTHYIIGGGKQGVLYLVDNTNMGHYNSSADQVVQSFQAIFGTGTSHIHGTPIYYNNPLSGPTIYVWGENDYLRAYAFNPTTQRITTTAVTTSNMTAPIVKTGSAMPGGFLSLRQR